MKRGLEDATVEELSEMLIQARKRVRVLEEVVARQANTCQHQFVIVFPSGMKMIIISIVIAITMMILIITIILMTIIIL